MRLFVAAENEAFLNCLRRVFKHTRVHNDCYPVITCFESSKVFRSLSDRQRVCLVVPSDAEVKLRLTTAGTKFVLHCPAASDCNTHGLTRAVMTLLAAEQMDVAVLPMLGHDSMRTARDMCRAMADTLVR